MRIYKSDTQIDIPQDLNLTELLHTSTDPPVPPSHLICKDSLTNRSITLGELRSRAGRIANGLKRALDPRDGSRWAVILPNSVEYLEVVHAVLWVGGVVCPINYAIKAEEIGHGFSVTRPDFVIAYGAVISKVLEAIKIAEDDLIAAGAAWRVPQIMTVIVGAQGYKHIPDDYFSQDKLAVPHYQDTRNRLATIHLSSGTTGKPKGVELTHFNFASNVYQLRTHDAAQFHRGSRIIAFTPFAHIGNTTFPLFFGPFMGIMHHAMPAYDLETFGQLVDSVKPTIFQGVPSVVITFANSDIADRYDFSKAEKIDCGGPPFKKDMYDRLMSKAPWRINQVYGMTEAAGYVAYQRSQDKQPDNVVGPLLPSLEIALRINEGKDDAPEGGPGEMWIRGPNISRGYAFNTEANRAAYPQDGWYNTGDVCTISKSGVIAVVGRTKELIKYKGFQVSPTELEAYLNSHPHVVEGGVGPKNPTGKILRKQLKDQRSRMLLQLAKVRRQPVRCANTAYSVPKADQCQLKGSSGPNVLFCMASSVI